MHFFWHLLVWFYLICKLEQYLKSKLASVDVITLFIGLLFLEKKHKFQLFSSPMQVEPSFLMFSQNRNKEFRFFPEELKKQSSMDSHELERDCTEVQGQTQLLDSLATEELEEVRKYFVVFF